jgi:uncharacterized MAPEG superfamily protein
MSIPVRVLLAFAGWTLALLLGTVGIYRWSRILTRRAGIAEFQADEVHGPDWYRRAMRAHANCVENLPVYGAIVVAMEAAGVRSPVLDRLSLVFIGARVLQTTIHVAFVQTNRAVAFRFTFFFVQFVCMVWMGVFVALA